MTKKEKKIFEQHLQEIENQIEIEERILRCPSSPEVKQESAVFLAALENSRNAIFDLLSDMGYDVRWYDGRVAVDVAFK